MHAKRFLEPHRIRSHLLGSDPQKRACFHVVEPTVFHEGLDGGSRTRAFLDLVEKHERLPGSRGVRRYAVRFAVMVSASSEFEKMEAAPSSIRSSVRRSAHSAFARTHAPRWSSRSGVRRKASGLSSSSLCAKIPVCPKLSDRAWFLHVSICNDFQLHNMPSATFFAITNHILRRFSELTVALTCLWDG